MESGCTSDRECILAVVGADNDYLQDDARLVRCLPSEEDETINVCKIPCENDGACGLDHQVCQDGYCKFIGCTSDEECRAFFNLENQEASETMPFVGRAVCRE